jgi:hypothetical protein
MNSFFERVREPPGQVVVAEGKTGPFGGLPAFSDQALERLLVFSAVPAAERTSGRDTNSSIANRATAARDMRFALPYASNTLTWLERTFAVRVTTSSSGTTGRLGIGESESRMGGDESRILASMRHTVSTTIDRPVAGLRPR